jgi:hypothetical protein
MADMLRMTDFADVFPLDLPTIVRFYLYNQMLALLQYPAFFGTIIDIYITADLDRSGQQRESGCQKNRQYNQGLRNPVSSTMLVRGFFSFTLRRTNSAGQSISSFLPSLSSRLPQ